MNRQLIDQAVRLFGAINHQIVALNRERGPTGAFAEEQRARWRRLEKLRRRAFQRWVRRGGHLAEAEY